MRKISWWEKRKFSKTLKEKLIDGKDVDLMRALMDMVGYKPQPKPDIYHDLVIELCQPEVARLYEVKRAALRPYLTLKYEGQEIAKIASVGADIYRQKESEPIVRKFMTKPIRIYVCDNVFRIHPHVGFPIWQEEIFDNRRFCSLPSYQKGRLFLSNGYGHIEELPELPLSSI